MCKTFLTTIFHVWKISSTTLMTVLLLLCRTGAAAESKSFYTLNNHNGLSSNCVLQMLQLADGRMVVVTDKAVDVFDGQRFLSAIIDTSQYVPLDAYDEACQSTAIGCLRDILFY